MPSSLCLLKRPPPIVPMSIDYQEGEWPNTMKEDLLKSSCHFSKWQQSTPMQTQYSLNEDAHLHLMQIFPSDFTSHFSNLIHNYSVFQFYLLILKHYLWLLWIKKNERLKEIRVTFNKRQYIGRWFHGWSLSFRPEIKQYGLQRTFRGHLIQLAVWNFPNQVAISH